MCNICTCIVINIYDEQQFLICTTRFSATPSSIKPLPPPLSPLFCLAVGNKVQNNICYNSVSVYLSYTLLLCWPIRYCWLLQIWLTTWLVEQVACPLPPFIKCQLVSFKHNVSQNMILRVIYWYVSFATKCVGVPGLLLVVVLFVPTSSW